MIGCSVQQSQLPGAVLVGGTSTFRKALVVLGLSFAFALAHQATAHATLQLLKQNPSDPATFSGKGGYSVRTGSARTEHWRHRCRPSARRLDGRAGLSVRKLFLPDAPDASQRTIDFDGTKSCSLTCRTPSRGAGLSTARATGPRRSRQRSGPAAESPTSRSVTIPAISMASRWW